MPTGSWPAERFQNLYTTCQDDGMAVMACHKSTEGDDIPCAGYVIVVGDNSIGYRIAASFGRIDPREYKADVPLYASFRQMLIANKVKLPARNIFLATRKRK